MLPLLCTCWIDENSDEYKSILGQREKFEVMIRRFTGNQIIISWIKSKNNLKKCARIINNLDIL
jgi:hypothetical protein